MEEWRPVAGFEGTYEVSSTGRVRRGGRILNPISKNGYVTYKLTKLPARRQALAHRLVAEAFIPNPEGKPLVRHLNDVRNDNRVENLAWGTQSDNMFDAVRNGRNHEANKTTCIRGHPFDGVRSRGQRTCSVCNRASRARTKLKAEATELPNDSPIHGTRNGYNTYRCRCDSCRTANTNHQRNLREKRKQNGNS